MAARSDTTCERSAPAAALAATCRTVPPDTGAGTGTNEPARASPDAVTPMAALPVSAPLTDARPDAAALTALPVARLMPSPRPPMRAAPE